MGSKFVYNDMFTGQPTTMRVKGDGLTPMERFWEKAHYRKASKLEREGGMVCSMCRWIYGAKKCNKVGISDSTATDIDRGYICDFFKSTHAEK